MPVSSTRSPTCFQPCEMGVVMLDAGMSRSALPPVLAGLDEPRVRRFLGTAVAGGHLSHAYLFLGVPGAGKLDAARALAQCVVCPNGGCGACDECIRVAHGTHPDVRLLRPGSSQGYLVDQARAVTDEVVLAPVRAHAKVYIVDQAGLLRGAAANALLKTIEEPPDGVMFILCARSVDAVLPTIASRCQQVPFAVRGSDASERSVERATGIGGWEARVALAVAGTPSNAAAFLSSPDRRACRRLTVRTISELARDDSWDVLVAAREIADAVKVPLAETRDAQEAVIEEGADFLSAGALKKLESANKRELTVREQSGLAEVLASVDSLLRDILVRCEGIREPVVNEDVADVVERIAAMTTTEGVLMALAAVSEASRRLARNVSPQLALEAMLLTIKEALYAHSHTGQV